MAVGSGQAVKSDINITPFIDVLLVLLVIFMITQPMLRKVLEIQVPKEEQSQSSATSTNIVIEIKDDGSLAINTQPVEKAALLAKFHEIYDNRAEKLLFIKVANVRPYKDVIDVIDVARGAGVKVFGLAPPTAEEAAAAAAARS
ncbi:MAG: ExbD/TolR family protein [Gemmatimonadales bacterium]